MSMGIVVMVVMLVYLVFLVLSMKSESLDNSASVYECGFDQMMGSRVEFSYRFFLISILFLVFDVEIVLLISMPFIILSSISMMGVEMFMMVLFWGLTYEYYNGVLSWAK